MRIICNSDLKNRHRNKWFYRIKKKEISYLVFALDSAKVLPKRTFSSSMPYHLNGLRDWYLCFRSALIISSSNATTLCSSAIGYAMTVALVGSSNATSNIIVLSHRYLGWGDLLSPRGYYICVPFSKIPHWNDKVNKKLSVCLPMRHDLQTLTRSDMGPVGYKQCRNLWSGAILV